METLSKKYAKPFMWKFSATSHRKGVVDGVGGKVKSMVRRKVMSKGRFTSSAGLQKFCSGCLKAVED